MDVDYVYVYTCSCLCFVYVYVDDGVIMFMFVLMLLLMMMLMMSSMMLLMLMLLMMLLLMMLLMLFCFVVLFVVCSRCYAAFTHTQIEARPFFSLISCFPKNLRWHKTYFVPSFRWATIYIHIYIYIYIYDVNDIYIYTYILFHVFILKDSSPLCFPPAISCEGKTTVPTPFSLRFYDSCSFTWTPFKFNILNASEINDSRTNELYSTLLMTSRNPYTQHQ